MYIALKTHGRILDSGRGATARFALLCLAFFLLTPVAWAGPQWISSWEHSIDAPWRIEPRPDGEGGMTYGAIPVSVLINDTMAWTYTADCGSLEDDDFTTCDREETQLRGILSVKVWERNIGSTFPIQPNVEYRVEDFHHIERTDGVWLKNTPAQEGTAHTNPDGDTVVLEQTVCNIWDGEDCIKWGMYDTSEWSGTLFYTPEDLSPGRDVILKVEVEIRYLSDEYAGLHEGRIRQYLKVHLGEDPLPKFDDRWAYGDIHYHSQGTDNTGEYGNSYRNTLHALNAVGLDFVFATDHANNNEQLAWAEASLDFSWDFDLLEVEDLNDFYYGLGDMSPARWQNHWHLLNGEVDNVFTGEEGINKPSQALSYPRRRTPTSWAVPQIFLGGELDVVPEVESGRSVAGFVHGGVMPLEDICKDIPADVDGFALKEYIESYSSTDLLECQGPTIIGICIEAFYDEGAICELDSLLVPTPEGTNQVRDIQNRELAFGRQHLLHLPMPNSTISEDQAGIVSNTNNYGGATRRMKELVATEYEGLNKGYFFLAHPINHSSGVSQGRLGPDLIPYSEVQLAEVFETEFFLGLQAWNENERLETHRGHGASSAGRKTHSMHHDPYNDFNYTNKPIFRDSTWEHEEKPTYRLEETRNGMLMWDHVQMWGLDPDKTRDLDWLSSGEPRRVFMAGGSDAHGDFNFRKTGYGWGTTGFNDTAIGTPRNLLFARQPEGALGSTQGLTGRAFSQTQIMEAFVAGHFSVTDGPALRIAMDINENGIIDDEDVPMGGVANGTIAPTDGSVFPAGQTFPLLVEWKSTEEWGPVKQIDLTLGSFSDVHEKGWLWAAPSFEKGDTDRVYTPSTGPVHVQRFFDDVRSTSYWFTLATAIRRFDGTGACNFEGQTLRLLIDPDPNGGTHPGMGGTCRIEIDPADYQISATGFDIDSGATWINSPELPDRLFVRADLKTDQSCEEDLLVPECVDRMAFSNPVWVVDRASTPEPLQSTAYCADKEEPRVAANQLTWSAVPGSDRYELWTADELTLVWSGLGDAVMGTDLRYTLLTTESDDWVKMRACLGDACTGFTQARKIELDPCGWLMPVPSSINTTPSCAGSSNQTIVSWESIPSSTEYQLWTADGGTLLYSGTQAFAYLAPETDLLVRARACNDFGCSDFTSAVTVEANVCNDPPFAPNPVSVNAFCPDARDGGTSSYNRINWTAPTFADSYEVWPDGWSVPLWTGFGTQVDLLLDENMTLRIKACNENGCSGLSAPVSGLRNPCSVAPLTPSFLNILPICNDPKTGLPTVNLADWQEMHAADVYQIWNASGTSMITTANDNSAYFTVNSDTNVRVRACNSFGCGGFSPAAQAVADACGGGGGGGLPK